MSSDVNAESNKPHYCFGVCRAVEVCNGVDSAVGKEYSFGNKFETEVDNGLTIDGTFIDAQLQAVARKAPHDFCNNF